MEENVGVYRHLLFELPDVHMLRVATVIAGAVFGTVTTWVLSPLSGVQATIIGGLVTSLFFYILPAVLSGEIVSRFGGVTGRWTYLMALVDQGSLFLFTGTVVIAESIIVESVQEAWQLLWLGLATVFVINVVMVAAARGRRTIHRNLPYALIFPGFLIGAFHVFIGRLIGIRKVLYLQNSILFIVSAVLLFITLLIFDFLLRANVDGLSVLDFPSAIILGEEQRLAGGITTEVYHQALHIEQEDGDTLRYNIPWVHPGPVEGFGGGRLTEELIDADTFFLHIPSDHSLDMADPAEGRARR